jgi:carboxyl-terminal processing protease
MRDGYGVLDAGSLRSGASNALEWGTIGGSVGYLRVNRFSGSAEASTPRPAQYEVLAAALDQMRNDLASTTTLVVDVALNGGGSDSAALLVASYFADTRRPVLRYEVDGAPAQEIIVPSRGGGETRPIVLLTSEITASAAECFVLMMGAFPHVTQTGGRTRGGLSSLLPKPFPNGFMVTLAYQRVLDAEGTSFEGVSIRFVGHYEIRPWCRSRGNQGRRRASVEGRRQAERGPSGSLGCPFFWRGH